MDELEVNHFNCRSVAVVGDKESRSAVIATQSPVLMRYGQELIPEVLLMSGVQLPKGRKLTMFDSHETGSIQKVLGSVRKLKVENDQLVSEDVHVNSSRTDVQALIDEGDVESFSVGYRVDKAIKIE